MHEVGLGTGVMSIRYGIGSSAEGQAHRAYALPGPPLLNCTISLLRMAGRFEHHLMGESDCVKLKSSLTLFAKNVPAESYFALAYMGKLWPQLTRYTKRGDLPIDNNRFENAIRPFLIRRKARFCSDTPAGARSSAVTCALVTTAKAKGLEPNTWLRRMLHELPAAKSVDAIEALLPWNLRKTDLVGETGALIYCGGWSSYNRSAAHGLV